MVGLGVRVNAIGPAVIPTAMTKPIIDDHQNRDAALARIPMGRFGTPDDLIGAAVFLLSPASAFVTGQILFVDGGRTDQLKSIPKTTAGTSPAIAVGA